MFLSVFKRSTSTLKCFASLSCQIKSVGMSTAPLSKIGTSDNTAHYDVIIVGGGAAGLSMACALCKLITFLVNAVRIGI